MNKIVEEYIEKFENLKEYIVGCSNGMISSTSEIKDVHVNTIADNDIFFEFKGKKYVISNDKLDEF